MCKRVVILYKYIYTFYIHCVLKKWKSPVSQTHLMLNADTGQTHSTGVCQGVSSLLCRPWSTSPLLFFITMTVKHIRKENGVILHWLLKEKATFAYVNFSVYTTLAYSEWAPPSHIPIKWQEKILMMYVGWVFLCAKPTLDSVSPNNQQSSEGR